MTTGNDETTQDPKTEQEILDSDLPLGQQIDLLLDLGKSKKQLIRMGFSDPLIRQRLKKRATAGTAAETVKTADMTSVIRGTEHITPFHTIEVISNLLDGNEEQRAVFKAGMLVPILGMQLYNEGQKSFASYMNAMKSENQEAMMKAMALNQDAAHQAAMESAQMVASTMAQSQEASAIATAKDPMGAVMAKSMMPLMENMIGMLTRTLMPGVAPQQGAVPTGWTVKRETPKTEDKEGE